MTSLAIIAVSAISQLHCGTVDANGARGMLSMRVSVDGAQASIQSDAVSGPKFEIIDVVPAPARHSLKFTALVDGKKFSGELGRGFLGRDYAELDLYATEGDIRGLPFVVGVCALGPAAAAQPSPKAVSEVETGRKVCRGITSSGVPFDFSYYSVASDGWEIRTSAFPAWNSGVVKLRRMSPPMSPDGDIFRGFASFDPIENEQGPSGVEMFYLNQTSMLATQVFSFNSMDARKTDVSGSRGHCGFFPIKKASA